jgi:hypothetical protein
MAPPRCPSGLSRPAQRAWRTAIASVDDPERYRRAVDDYARAVSRADRLHTEWRRLGKPVTAIGGSTGRTLVPHPLLAAMDSAEDHCPGDDTIHIGALVEYQSHSSDCEHYVLDDPA